MFSFNKRYFFFAVFLFLIEVLIALYLHDKLIRPYIGDLLVVILIYAFVKSFLNIRPLPLAIGVLLFSYMVETLQYFHIVEKIGLSHSRLAVVVIGNSFSWSDIIAYTVGIAFVLLVEVFLPKFRNNRLPKNNCE